MSERVSRDYSRTSQYRRSYLGFCRKSTVSGVRLYVMITNLVPFGVQIIVKYFTVDAVALIING